jgi:hypothetical protein
VELPARPGQGTSRSGVAAREGAVSQTSGCCVWCCLCAGLRVVVGFLAVVLLIMWLAACNVRTVRCSFAGAPIPGLHQRGLYR